VFVDLIVAAINQD